jgi:large subunit ribosomal protein L25
MAEIVLNVQVREKAGGGAARAARRSGLVPGVLYGAGQDPVAIAMREADFTRALTTGKLPGHLVTLKYGEETQPVIAKDVQFHPVTDTPLHFDLFRVDEHQAIRISIPVRFRNHEASPGLKRGGALNVNLHEVEVSAPANRIPEEIVIDLTGLEIGDAVRAFELPLPEGVELTLRDKETTVASVAAPSALRAEEEEKEAEEAAAEAPEGEAPAEGEAEPES